MGTEGKKELTKRQKFFGILFLVGIAWMVVRVAWSDQVSYLENPIYRFLTCLALLFWAIVYLGLTWSGGWKMFFGAVQIAAALIFDWIQLGKIAVEGPHAPRFDRWAFIAGAMVVIAHGFQDMSDGTDMLKKEDEKKISISVLKDLKAPPRDSAPPK